MRRHSFGSKGAMERMSRIVHSPFTRLARKASLGPRLVVISFVQAHAELGDKILIQSLLLEEILDHGHHLVRVQMPRLILEDASQLLLGFLEFLFSTRVRARWSWRLGFSPILPPGFMMRTRPFSWRSKSNLLILYSGHAHVPAPSGPHA